MKSHLGEQRVTGPSPERGMVFQKGALFEWMSVRKNVSFGPELKGMPKGEMNEIVDHLLEVVGLQDFQGKGDLRAFRWHAAACGFGQMSRQ